MHFQIYLLVASKDLLSMNWMEGRIHIQINARSLILMKVIKQNKHNSHITTMELFGILTSLIRSKIPKKVTLDWLLWYCLEVGYITYLWEIPNVDPALKASHPHHNKKSPIIAFPGLPIGGSPLISHRPNLGPINLAATNAMKRMISIRYVFL